MLNCFLIKQINIRDIFQMINLSIPIFWPVVCVGLNIKKSNIYKMVVFVFDLSLL